MNGSRTKRYKWRVKPERLLRKLRSMQRMWEQSSSPPDHNIGRGLKYAVTMIEESIVEI